MLNIIIVVMHSLQFDFIDWEGPGKVRFFFFSPPNYFLLILTWIITSMSVSLFLLMNCSCLQNKIIVHEHYLLFFKWAIIYNSKGERRGHDSALMLSHYYQNTVVIPPRILFAKCLNIGCVNIYLNVRGGKCGESLQSL